MNGQTDKFTETEIYMGSQVALVVKSLSANAADVRDAGSIPGSGRSPGGRHSNPLQYSCLENPMDRGAWQATAHGITQSWTRLKQFSKHTQRYTYTHWRYTYIYIYIYEYWIYTGIYIYIHTLEYNGILFSHERERNLVICNNTDAPWRFYAAWNKLDRES